jgi:hypothetical protein
MKTEKENKVQPKKKGDVLKRYRNAAAVISIFFVLITGIFLRADIISYASARDNLQQEINHYYYRGWKIKTLRHNFLSTHSDKTILSYAKTQLGGKEVAQFRDLLHQEIDLQKSKRREIVSQKARAASIFYIDQIQQDTEELETYFEDFEEGMDEENLYTAEWAISNIEEEITELSKQQEEDIQREIEKKIGLMDDIAFLGGLYGIDLNSSLDDKIESYESKDMEPIETFIAMDSVIEGSKEELLDAIETRGGQASPDGKRIVIDISSQHLYMIENDAIIYDMPASTGVYHHATVPGEFEVLEKIDMAWGYYEIWMPYWMTIYYAGSSANGIHGIPISPSGQRWSHWEQVVGVRPITYGCVMPKDRDAEKLYEWASVGTPVSIFY